MSDSNHSLLFHFPPSKADSIIQYEKDMQRNTKSVPNKLLPFSVKPVEWRGGIDNQL
jgi:hypothetical protein